MEIQILDWLQKLHTPVLDKIMCLITRLGDAGILWILLAAVLLLIPKTRKRRIDPGRGAGCGCSPLQSDFKASGSQNPAL